MGRIPSFWVCVVPLRSSSIVPKQCFWPCHVGELYSAQLFRKQTVLYVFVSSNIYKLVYEVSFSDFVYQE